MKHPKMTAFCKKAWPVLLAVAVLCGAGMAALQLFSSSPTPGEFAFAGSVGATQVVVMGSFSLDGLLWDGMILSAVLAGVAFLIQRKKTD